MCKRNICYAGVDDIGQGLKNKEWARWGTTSGTVRRQCVLLWYKADDSTKTDSESR